MAKRKDTKQSHFCKVCGEQWWIEYNEKDYKKFTEKGKPIDEVMPYLTDTESHLIEHKTCTSCIPPTMPMNSTPLIKDLEDGVYQVQSNAFGGVRIEKQGEWIHTILEGKGNKGFFSYNLDATIGGLRLKGDYKGSIAESQIRLEHMASLTQVVYKNLFMHDYIPSNFKGIAYYGLKEHKDVQPSTPEGLDLSSRPDNEYMVLMNATEERGLYKEKIKAESEEQLKMVIEQTLVGELVSYKPTKYM
ncbi:hypothetical protein [Bacillus toyonensis]|uniref:hypothetical protein n=1 Tax=Bacillus toyonensis TaxID=155322 RepID=UPI000BF84435|nr:hypothetical protein [Bacillus toyonensis]PGF05084.1 hypothetical protein COM61_01235 [Bacillus toyonensis]